MTHAPQRVPAAVFNRNVPRYTSYPPATQFAGGVDAATYADWLAAVPAHSPVSVYVHVPFCRRLCWFCACRTQGTRTAAPVEAYVETLLAEIAMLRHRLPQGVTRARLHWGGGTPTLLTPDQIARLAAALDAAIPPAPGAEFSVEIDPGEIDAPRLDALAAAGLTRASIGVQDFDPAIQAAIGREQSYEATRAAAEGIRARGVASLNADILYGLPHQTPARIADTVQMLLSLAPDRVALYGYAHVPWMARRQTMIPAEALPAPQARLALAQTARDLFLWDGFEAIGIDHFAKPEDSLAVAARTGHLRRNFQGYTDDTAPVLLGLGASSISRLPQGYAQNAAATAVYTRQVRAGELPTARGHAFSTEDIWRARVIEQLMCEFRADRDEAVRHGATPAAFADTARAAAAAVPEAAEMTVSGLRIAPEARVAVRLVAAAFDAYHITEGTHSPAI